MAALEVGPAADLMLAMLGDPEFGTESGSLTLAAASGDETAFATLLADAGERCGDPRGAADRSGRDAPGSCRSCERGPSRSGPSRLGSRRSAGATTSSRSGDRATMNDRTSSSGPRAASAGSPFRGSGGSSWGRRTSARPYNFLLAGTTGGSSATRSRTRRSTAPTRWRHRPRWFACIAPSATRPGCGSCDCSPAAICT